MSETVQTNTIDERIANSLGVLAPTAVNRILNVTEELTKLDKAKEMEVPGSGDIRFIARGEYRFEKGHPVSDYLAGEQLVTGLPCHVTVFPETLTMKLKVGESTVITGVTRAVAMPMDQRIIESEEKMKQYLFQYQQEKQKADTLAQLLIDTDKQVAKLIVIVCIIFMMGIILVKIF